MEGAIKLHDQMGNIGTFLSNTAWADSRLLKHVIQPIMTAEKRLEGGKYVAVSLLVHYVSDIRDGLKLPVSRRSDEDRDGESVISYLGALLEGFDNR